MSEIGLKIALVISQPNQAKRFIINNFSIKWEETKITITMEYTQEQIELMDRIFDFCIQKKQGNCSCNQFIQQYKTKREPTEFVYDEVCRIGQELGFFTSEHFGGGIMGIISIDYSKASQFKKNGGFKEYLKEKQNEIRA